LSAARKALKKLNLGFVLMDYLHEVFPSIRITSAFHLVTTRPLTDEALSFMRENNVAIHDRMWLYDKWPDCVIDWAGYCNIKCYFPFKPGDAEANATADIVDDDSDDDDEYVEDSVSSNENSEEDEDENDSEIED
jgi:hypothetical protein